MKCSDYERWISDGLGGALPADRAARLRSHLGTCASCRDFELRASRIQAEAEDRPADPLPESYWRDSLARLRRNLEDKAPRPGKKAVLGLDWRWVFAAAPLVLAAAVGLVLVLRPGGGAAVPYDLTADEQLNLITQELGDDPALENAFNSILESSIDEQLGSGDDFGGTSMDNPLLGQDISDEEMTYIIQELKKELGS